MNQNDEKNIDQLNDLIAELEDAVDYLNDGRSDHAQALLQHQQQKIIKILENW